MLEYISKQHINGENGDHMKICPNCKYSNNDHAKFCTNCRYHFLEPSNYIYCKKCGQRQSSKAVFCKNCGHTLTNNRNNPEKTFPKQYIACPNCHYQNPKLIRYCLNCGSRLISDTTNNQIKVETHQKFQTPKVNISSKSKLSLTTKLWIFYIVGFIFLLLGSYYFFYGNWSTKQNQHQKYEVKATKSSTKLIYNNDVIKKNITTAMQNISGKSSIYVTTAKSNQSYSINNRPQLSASVIKLFILGAAFMEANDNHLNLNDSYILKDSDKVGGTGILQNKPNGTSYTYRQLLTYMIDFSDNTATNIIIDKLGGVERTNSLISKFNVKNTKLQRKMMNFNAKKDNYTSAEDTALFLKQLYNHQLLSKSSDEEMLKILKQNTDHSKLLKNLPASTVTYNKTGINSDQGIQNDAAIISNKNGAIIVVVLSEKGNSSQQISTMNNLGESLYRELLQ